MTKTFKLDAIVTVLTEQVCCELDDIYDILSHIVGFRVYTTNIPGVIRQCGEHILLQHPELNGVDVNRFDEIRFLNDDNAKIAVGIWMKELKRTYKESYDISPMSEEEGRELLKS